MPAPPSLLGEAQRVLALLGFPDVFAGLPPAPANPVPPPRAGPARMAFRAARASTFEVLADGCDAGYLNQGSGFVVRPGYLLTNAHVVAGTTRQWVHAPEADHQARVVAFDPDEDLALLRVADLNAPSLSLLDHEVPRGHGGRRARVPGRRTTPRQRRRGPPGPFAGGARHLRS